MRYAKWLVIAGVLSIAILIGPPSTVQAAGGRIITTGPADSGVQQPPVVAGAAVVTDPAMPDTRPLPPGTFSVQVAPPMPDPPGAGWHPAAPGQPYGPGAIWVRGDAGPAAGPPQKKMMVFLGVAVSPAGETLDEQLQLPPGTALVVDAVEEGTPAAAAGLKPHDVLTRFGDQMLINPPQLHTLVRIRKAGEKVTLSLFRGGSQQKVDVTLAEAERPVMPEPAMIWLRQAAPFQTMTESPAPPQNVPEAGGRQRGGAANPARTEAGATASTSSFSDADHTLTVTVTNGSKRLLAKDKDGKVVFDGPINTPEELNSVPEPIREKLKNIHVNVNQNVPVQGGGRRGPADPAVEPGSGAVEIAGPVTPPSPPAGPM